MKSLQEYFSQARNRRSRVPERNIRALLNASAPGPHRRNAAGTPGKLLAVAAIAGTALGTIFILAGIDNEAGEKAPLPVRTEAQMKRAEDSARMNRVGVIVCRPPVQVPSLPIHSDIRPRPPLKGIPELHLTAPRLAQLGIRYIADDSLFLPLRESGDSVSGVVFSLDNVAEQVPFPSKQGRDQYSPQRIGITVRMVTDATGDFLFGNPTAGGTTSAGTERSIPSNPIHQRASLPLFDAEQLIPISISRRGARNGTDLILWLEPTASLVRVLSLEFQGDRQQRQGNAADNRTDAWVTRLAAIVDSAGAADRSPDIQDAANIPDERLPAWNDTSDGAVARFGIEPLPGPPPGTSDFEPTAKRATEMGVDVTQSSDAAHRSDDRTRVPNVTTTVSLDNRRSIRLLIPDNAPVDTSSGSIAEQVTHPGATAPGPAYSVVFALTHPRQVSLTLHNLKGKQLYSLSKPTRIDKGEHRLPFNLPGLPPGCYLAVLTTDRNERLVRCLTVAPGFERNTAEPSAESIPFAERTAVGAPVPPFSLALLGSGDTLTETSLRGSYCILDFWASWCGPCLEQMERLHALHERYREQGLKILSLSFDRREKDVERFRDGQWPMPWLHTFLPEGLGGDVARDFNVRALPKMILIGPEGTILAIDRSTADGAIAKVLAARLGTGEQQNK